MKILIIASRKNEFSLGRIYTHAFKQLGHDLYEFYDLDEMENFSSLFYFRFFKNINWWRLQLKNSWKSLQKLIVSIFNPFLLRAQLKSNKKLIKLSEKIKPDVVFTIPGRSIYKHTLKQIYKKTNCIFLTYHGDSYDNFYSTSKYMLDALPLYDIVFSYSMSLFNTIERLNAKRIEYLPFAFNPEIHKKVLLNNNQESIYSCDIAFVGTWDENREKTLEDLFDLNLGIWGPGWNKISRFSKLSSCVKKVGIIDYNETSKIYQNAKIVLNPLRDQNSDSHNMKSFEIPMMGGLMCSRRTADHENFFGDSNDILLYENNDSLRRVILGYLNSDIKPKFSNDHYKIFLKKHTYCNRAKFIIDKIEEVRSKKIRYTK